MFNIYDPSWCSVILRIFFILFWQRWLRPWIVWCRWTPTEREGWGTSTLRVPRTPISSLDPSKTTRQQHINKYSGYIESWLHFSALLSCYLVLIPDRVDIMCDWVIDLFFIYCVFRKRWWKEKREPFPKQGSSQEVKRLDQRPRANSK